MPTLFIFIYLDLQIHLTGTKQPGSRHHVSAREYYCFLMQIRSGVFNTFFHGGCLFQQWIVDMYIKIESMRLEWYSNPNHQKIIRADLHQVSLKYLIY
jgi:hypothetical protein